MHPLFDLTGKTAVITGGLGFLGRHFARALADAGAQVVVSDVDDAKCREFARELSESCGQPVHGMGIDLLQEASVDEWGKRILKEIGPVDVLVNNAQLKTKNYFAPLAEFPLEDWEKIMGVNVSGMFLAARALGPAMVERGKGSIINLSSIYGMVGPDQRIYEGSYHEAMGSPINTPAIYSASKGAVISLTRYLATYWGPRGVRANTLTPGGVENAQNDVFQRNYSSRVPMGRMATTQDMIGPLVFLASDASSYINGHNLVVDGGWTAW